MTIRDPYRYAIALYRGDGNTVVQRRIAMDWDPALEWTRFEALRRGKSPECVSGDSRIDPIWSASGSPDVDGLTVSLTGGAEPHSIEFSRQYFAASAKALGAECVSAGSLEADETVNYVVTAFPTETVAHTSPPDPFDLEEVTVPPPIEACGRADFVESTKGARLGAFEVADVPVVVPEWIVDEIRERALGSQGLETGGFLTGHLARCGEDPELLVNVTAQLEAEHTLSELTRLTFTAQTWTDLRERMKLRKRNELLLGWWHSHPVREWNCKDCPAERQRVCPLAGDFFSEHDRALHRTVFPMGYAVGLVANDVAFSSMTFSMFGWRRGLLEARGFYLTPSSMEGSGEVARAASASSDGGLDGS